MWELGNLWTHEAGKSSTTPMAASSSYLSVMHEIHVLLVDHDSDSLISTAKLLELCQYRVTLAELASGAIQTLSAGKVKFDIVMANVNSPDLHGFKLLQHATSMDIPVILMYSFDENMLMAMRALESGAFLYLRKPATKEMLKCLWQHVAWEKIRMAKERERERERESLLAAGYNNSVRAFEFSENPNMMDEKMDKLKKNNYNIVGRKEDYESGNINHIKRKVCTEWTRELHQKFMDAVQQLGEGRCFPKEILELMDVPGLTRMQVASHLQKCRNDNWRSPEERKSNSNSQNLSSDPDHIAAPHKPRRFGSMPKISNASTSNETTSGSKTPQSEAEMQNNSGVDQNMETEPTTVVTNNNPPYHHHHHQQYGTIVPAVGTYSGNPRNTSVDYFFNFTDMDCLVQNYSGLPQVSAGLNNSINANSNAGDYHFGSVYHRHDQNPKIPRVDNRSQWISETTSKFGTDQDYETRGH
ncbi:hypothetical protein OROMI_004483 [Orobanche minor]